MNGVGKSEIDELDLHGAGDDNIIRFDVPMHDLELVTVPDGLDNLFDVVLAFEQF